MDWQASDHHHHQHQGGDEGDDEIVVPTLQPAEELYTLDKPDAVRFRCFTDVGVGAAGAGDEPADVMRRTGAIEDFVVHKKRRTEIMAADGEEAPDVDVAFPQLASTAASQARRRYECLQWLRKGPGVDEAVARFALERRLGATPSVAAYNEFLRLVGRQQQQQGGTGSSRWTATMMDALDAMVIDGVAPGESTFGMMIDTLSSGQRPRDAARVALLAASRGVLITEDQWLSILQQLLADQDSASSGNAAASSGSGGQGPGAVDTVGSGSAPSAVEIAVDLASTILDTAASCGARLPLVQHILHCQHLVSAGRGAKALEVYRCFVAPAASTAFISAIHDRLEHLLDTLVVAVCTSPECAIDDVRWVCDAAVEAKQKQQLGIGPAAFSAFAECAAAVRDARVVQFTHTFGQQNANVQSLAALARCAAETEPGDAVDAAARGLFPHGADLGAHLVRSGIVERVVRQAGSYLTSTSVGGGGGVGSAASGRNSIGGGGASILSGPNASGVGDQSGSSFFGLKADDIRVYLAAAASDLATAAAVAAAAGGDGNAASSRQRSLQGLQSLAYFAPVTAHIDIRAAVSATLKCLEKCQQQQPQQDAAPASIQPLSLSKALQALNAACLRSFLEPHVAAGGSHHGHTHQHGQHQQEADHAKVAVEKVLKHSLWKYAAEDAHTASMAAAHSLAQRSAMAALTGGGKPDFYVALCDRDLLVRLACDAEAANAVMSMMRRYENSCGAVMALPFAQLVALHDDSAVPAAAKRDAFRLVVQWLRRGYQWFTVLPFTFDVVALLGPAPATSGAASSVTDLLLHAMSSVKKGGHAKVALMSADSAVTPAAAALGLAPVIQLDDVMKRIANANAGGGKHK